MNPNETAVSLAHPIATKTPRAPVPCSPLRRYRFENGRPRHYHPV
ncbi:MAG: hypothetical protein R6X34_29935 [Chloroflexota bacterium]